MRAGNKSDEIRGHYLGELAPYLEAARPLDSLSPTEKKRVRRRIARTLFGTRFLGLRARLLPVLAALALLVLGGVAFATAQRLGFLPRIGQKGVGASASETTREARRRKPGRGRASASAANAPGLGSVGGDAAGPASEPAVVVLPEVPDPLRYPALPAPSTPLATPPAWIPWAEARSAEPAKAVTNPRKPSEVAAVSPRGLGRQTGQVAMAEPWPAPQSSVALADSPTLAPVAAYTAPGGEAAPTNIAPDPMVAAAPSKAAAPAPAMAPAPTAVPTPAAAPAVAPVPPATQPSPNPPSREQVLFGQALRKLRSANDPTAALAMLQDHAKAYPKSAFAGERTALEVEALLGLHRDRDALALLDGIALDGLPRSGERFVVRGELRAAARRWREAEADFDQALAQVSGSPTWHERALWGRGVARLRLNDPERGMADIERYRDTYPKGRFAAEAAKFFPKK